jgi:uncharacterized membrane protein YcgQ (UPF0703/DUF1980 family)
MKKYFALIIVCLLLVTGCGGGYGSGNGNGDSSGSANGDGSGNGSESESAAAVATLQEDNTVPAGNTDPSADVVEIKEKMFIAQCNDIYLNPADYIGKTVRIEGLYDEYTDESGNTNRGVIRNGPGCCGNDGVAGFEFMCESVPACKQNDWVSVEGVIRPYTYDDGYETVIIGAASVAVKTERGAEFVTQ